MRLAAALAVLAVVQSGNAPQIITAQTRNCLHGSNESPAEKVRRDGAVRYARAVNDAETDAKRNGKYVPTSALTKLPEVPSGFRVQLTTDSTTYMLSMKDTLDLCGFALFSDQQGDRKSTRLNSSH